MTEKPADSTTFGLELQDNQFKGVQLSFVKGKPKLDKLFDFFVDLTNVNPLYTDEQNQDLKNRIDKSLTISALPTQDVLVRQMEIKLKKDKDIQEVLPFQSEPLLPYPAENAIIDSIKLKPTEEGTLLTVLAVRKDHLQSHLDKWTQLQIEPESVIAEPTALAAFAANFCSKEQLERPLFLIHIDLIHSFCILLQEGKLIAAQSTSHGIDGLENPKESDTEAPSETWNELKLELKRLLFSIGKQLKTTPAKNLMVVGPGALIPQLAEELANEADMLPVLPNNESMPDLTLSNMLNYAIPLGAALSGLPGSKDRVNFRQEEFAYPHPWKRLFKPLAIYASLCFATALAFYLFGAAYHNYRQGQIKSEYVELLETINKPYNTFEEEYEKKNDITGGNLLTISQLNENDLFNRVQSIEKDLQATPDTFPLLPNVPKVSDVLAWLSTHHLQTNDNKNKFPIQIENFNYTLVKRPELNKKQEKYQVKVEMEFTSPTPKQAREFHDALIEPNDFIDPKGEVKWNAGKGRYRTSFYLKDKTIYPSSSS
jgi:type IV pilus assembly protein PilM